MGKKQAVKERREKVKNLFLQGYSKSAIAGLLGVSNDTIRRDIEALELSEPCEDETTDIKQRRKEVENLYLQGYRKSVIADYLGVSDDTVWKDIEALKLPDYDVWLRNKGDEKPQKQEEKLQRGRPMSAKKRHYQHPFGGQDHNCKTYGQCHSCDFREKGDICYFLCDLRRVRVKGCALKNDDPGARARVEIFRRSLPEPTEKSPPGDYRSWSKKQVAELLLEYYSQN